MGVKGPIGNDWKLRSTPAGRPARWIRVGPMAARQQQAAQPTPLGFGPGDFKRPGPAAIWRGGFCRGNLPYFIQIGTGPDPQAPLAGASDMISQLLRSRLFIRLIVLAILYSVAESYYITLHRRLLSLFLVDVAIETICLEVLPKFITISVFNLQE